MSVRRPFALLVLVSLVAFGCSGASSSADLSPGTDAGAGGGDAAAAVDAAAADEATDAGADAAGDAGAPPITAPADTWTWVDFPESKCGSGTATGIGVNPHAGASDVLVYLEGGGACGTGPSCWGAEPKAANMDGYDAAKFAAAPQKGYPIFSRTLAANPFLATNMVYVPYCTGDMHAGTAEVDLQVNGAKRPTYFWGARDLELFLARLAPTFPAAKRVTVVGTSAGGFGSYLTFDRVVRAFPAARVDVIDDSGPAIVPKNGGANGSFGVWGVVPPAGCSPCTTFRQVLTAARALQPNSRFGFLTFTEDPVISADFGYSLEEYPAVMTAFSDSLAGDPNAATFLFTNKQQHVVQTAPLLAVQYLPWFTQMVTDDPAWKDATYAVP